MIQFLKHGQITASFKGYSFSVASQVGNQHTGQDEVKGYGKSWISDNPGIVYKVYKPSQSFNWAAVHMLCDNSDGNWYEYIPLGHASKIIVNEGDFVRRGQVVGEEGNHGMVFSGGREVTWQERIRGSKAGTHNHRGIRPIKFVSQKTNGKHYLRDTLGRDYIHEGKYCEIVHDNNTNGWIDPNLFYPSEVTDRLELDAYNARADGNTNLADIYFAVVNFIKSFKK